MTTSRESKQEITSYQAFAIVVSSMAGVGVLSLPREVSKGVGTEAIYVILLFGLVVWVAIFFMSKLITRFPRQHFAQYVPGLLGSTKGKAGKVLIVPILIGVALYWIGAVSGVARLFGEAVNASMLQTTPIEVIMLTLIGVSAIVAGAEPVIIGRLNELLLPLRLIPILFLVFGLLTKGDLTHLLPLFQLDWKKVMKGILLSSFAFAGYEVLLMFGGYYKKPEASLKVHTLAVAAVTLGYWGTFVSTISVFGVAEVQTMIWPTLEFFKVIVNPNLVIERLESAMLTIWLSNVFLSMTNTYAALVLMIKNYFQLKEKAVRRVSWLFALIIYAVAIYPRNLQQVFEYTGWLGIIALVISTLLPIFLLLLAIARKKRGVDSRETTSSS